MNLVFKVDKPLEIVFDYLTDMQKFVEVHPVIRKIDHLEGSKYLVYETLKFGFIPFSFKYPVSVEKEVTNQTVIMRAVVMKLTKVEMSFTLTAENNMTVVNEALTFKSILPIKSMMQKVFREQHTLLFENIGAL